MNNAVFCKRMENARNRRNIEVVTTEKRRDKLVARRTFRTPTIIIKDFTAIENYPTSVRLKKPGYVGLTVLEDSKGLRG